MGRHKSDYVKKSVKIRPRSKNFTTLQRWWFDVSLYQLPLQKIVKSLKMELNAVDGRNFFMFNIAC